MLDTLLLMILLVAVIFDLRIRQIPNWLVFGGILAAFIINLQQGGYGGLISSFQGLTVGICLLLIPFTAGGIGAGDVKLLGMVGAFKGMYFAFTAFLWMALWGGLFALIILLIHKSLITSLQRLYFGLIAGNLGAICRNEGTGKKDGGISYPYAVPILLGVISSYCKGW